MNLKKVVSLSLFLFPLFMKVDACTIFSGIDKKGHVWAGNNEDGLFNFNFYINLVKRTDSTCGYFYFTASNDPDEYIQGGVNDAGLFYDGNSVPPSEYKDYDKKMDFPGGHRAMLEYVMGKCKTVPEVLNLFEKYRLPGTETGQLHFADRYGNLGIIVADSMWITKANYQVSTNYNVCHPDKDNQTCWRYPIAERILRSKEPGIDSFREICDSTSQKAVVSTIYSNIHNLNTGDVWFYYAMDYNRPYKTNIKQLLRKEKVSFPVYELFTDVPVVEAYKAYEKNGLEACIKRMNEYQLTSESKYKIGRLLYSHLVVRNHNFSISPFLMDLMKSREKADELVQVINSLTLFCTDKKSEALNVLNDYLANYPDGQMVELAEIYLNQMQGIFDEESNVKFELNGYENSKCVFVEGLDDPNFTYFLVKKNGTWIGEFNLEPGEYHYVFLVDGQRVLDPKNNDIVKDNGLDYSRISVD